MHDQILYERAITSDFEFNHRDIDSGFLPVFKLKIGHGSQEKPKKIIVANH